MPNLRLDLANVQFSTFFCSNAIFLIHNQLYFKIFYPQDIMDRNNRTQQTRIKVI